MHARNWLKRPDWEARVCDDQQGEALFAAHQPLGQGTVRSFAADTNFVGSDLDGLVGLSSCFMLVPENLVGRVLGGCIDAFPLALPENNSAAIASKNTRWRGLRLEIGQGYGAVPLHLRGLRSTFETLPKQCTIDSCNTTMDDGQHPFQSLDKNPQIEYVFEAPGPFWLKGGRVRCQVLLPDGRRTTANSFDDYDLNFHVYWDRTCQAMTCGSITSGDWCWPYVLSIPPFVSPQAPELVCQLSKLLAPSLGLGSSISRDLVQQAILPCLNRSDLLRAKHVLQVSQGAFQYNSLAWRNTQEALRLMHHFLARPLSLEIHPCCRTQRDMCDWCTAQVENDQGNQKRKNARHAWIMVPALVVDAWLRNPFFASPPGIYSNVDVKSVHGIDVRIKNSSGLQPERCNYSGVQAFVVNTHKRDSEGPIPGESYGTSAVRFHVWSVPSYVLDLPDLLLRRKGYWHDCGSPWNSIWTLSMQFDDRDGRTSLPGLTWQILARDLDYVRCPWYTESDTINRRTRAITNAVSHPQGVNIPWVFAEVESEAIGRAGDEETRRSFFSRLQLLSK